MENRTDDVTFTLREELNEGDEHFLENVPECHVKCQNSYTNKKTFAHKAKSSNASNRPACDKNAATNSGIIFSRFKHGSSVTKSIDQRNQCIISAKERDRKGEHKLLLVSMKDRQNVIMGVSKDIRW